ncbi:zinc-binding dehydrogenase [Sodalis sp. RH21]|uniref:zinc-binding dehydrogenase n=1 Tax=unclassified Sodalis (in: enterobacteria) TaxID=2636512 RepID=UPI0039B4DE9C
MSAVVSLGAGKLRYLDRLEPKNGDWPRWQVCYCGICKTDRLLAWSTGTEGLVLGHEVVCRDGRGHYYALNNEINCGNCDYCREKLTSHCRHLYELGVTHHGGFANWLSAPPHSLYLLPLRDARLGMLAEPLACAIHGVGRLCIALALQQVAEPRILIIGSGVAGKMLAHLLYHRITARLTLCDIDAEAMAWARNTSIECRSTPFHEHYHVVIECSGGQGSLALALSAVRRAGAVMIYGIPDSGEALPIPMRDIFNRELTLLASMAGCTQETFSEAIRYLEQHQAFFATLLGRQVSLQQLPGELLHNAPQAGTRSWVTVTPQ